MTIVIFCSDKGHCEWRTSQPVCWCFSDSLVHTVTTMTSMSPTLSNQIDKSWADRLVPSLNVLLADFEMMRFNVRAVMWNGWGEMYPALLETLPQYLEHTEGAVEALARRVRCLEGHPPSTMEAILEMARIPAHDGTLHFRACMRSVTESLSHLLGEERTVLTTAQHAGDEVTAAALTSLMSFQEEALWKLRSSLRRTAFAAEYHGHG